MRRGAQGVGRPRRGADLPENNKTSGSDPAVLKLLVSGEVQFFTLMGGILGNIVPAANIQQVVLRQYSDPGDSPRRRALRWPAEGRGRGRLTTAH